MRSCELKSHVIWFTVSIRSRGGGGGRGGGGRVLRIFFVGGGLMVFRVTEVG